MKINIDKNEEKAEERLAAICAQLVREAVLFDVTETSKLYIIEFSGGF